MDTIVMAPSFIEDVLAPGQGQSLISVFRDRYFEEHVYPNIFVCQMWPEANARYILIYSEICKSDLQNLTVIIHRIHVTYHVKQNSCKWRRCFKVQIAMRKYKSSGMPLYAGCPKKSDTIHDLILKDIAYKFLNP